MPAHSAVCWRSAAQGQERTGDRGLDAWTTNERARAQAAQQSRPPEFNHGAAHYKGDQGQTSMADGPEFQQPGDQGRDEQRRHDVQWPPSDQQDERGRCEHTEGRKPLHHTSMNTRGLHARAREVVHEHKAKERHRHATEQVERRDLPAQKVLVDMVPHHQRQREPLERLERSIRHVPAAAGRRFATAAAVRCGHQGLLVRITTHGHLAACGSSPQRPAKGARLCVASSRPLMGMPVPLGGASRP
ncbi:unnamed protein product [Brugia timori]|uniref:LigA n=1 Tax=Brugia timori TaxID=42155 RepID=A0A0R3R5Y9_9BILA|nr:unnamed protein product [Brugia timori]